MAVPRSRKCLVLGDLTDCLLQAYECVGRRAYQKFLARGAEPGRELDDWLAAERELLRPITVDLEESEEFVHALASAPCFSNAHVDVSVEPRWLAILAENYSAAGSAASSADGSAAGQAFSIVRLPAEVVPKSTVAILGDGVVGIRMPKAVKAAKHSPFESLADFVTR